MSKKLFDSSFVLINHIDDLLPRLDLLKDLVEPKTSFSDLMEKKQGQNLLNFISEYREAMKSKSKLPKCSDSIKKPFDEFTSQLQNAVRILDYTFSWVDACRKQLSSIVSNTADIQLRCGYTLTIDTIKLFNTFTKICIFFRYYPHCSTIASMIPHFDKLRQLPLNNNWQDIAFFAQQCISSPFGFVHKILKSCKRPLIQFISQIGPFLIQVFGPWPIIKWDDFCIFNRSEEVKESTLPSNQVLILLNLKHLRELCFFFCMVYSEFVGKNPQYNSLMTAVFSEAKELFITRTTNISFDQIFEMQSRSGQELMKSMLANITNESQIKQKIGHQQRILHLKHLLRDIVDLCEFESSHIPYVIYQLLPLSAFAYYEVDAALTSNLESADIASLIDILVHTAMLFSKHQRVIQRFFIFNLGTVDLNYLDSMNDMIRDSTEEWQHVLYQIFTDLSNQVRSIDLEQFDQGTNYDFLPFLITLGRLQYHFAQVQISERATFLYPMFEHLEVFALHASFAMDPIKAFLNYAPIQTLWRHYMILLRYVQTSSAGIHNYSRFPTLFAFFNYDAVALSILPTTQELLKMCIQEMRKTMLGSLNQHIFNYMGFSSPITAISKINRLDRVFDPEPFIRHLDFSEQAVMTEISFKTSIWQVREFLRCLPGYVEMNGSEMKITPYLTEGITENIAPIICSGISADSQALDLSLSTATQYVWGLFTMMGSSYPRQMLQIRFNNAACPSEITFLEMVSIIRNEVDKPLPKAPVLDKKGRPIEEKKSKEESSTAGDSGEPKQLKILEYYTNRLKDFVSGDYKKMYYLPHSSSFENAEQLSYDAFKLLSGRSFRHLIQNLGLHAGFQLDKTLINEISYSMFLIFNTYQSLSKDINTWYLSFKENSSAWFAAAERSEIRKTAEELIKLGMLIQARELLRQAMHDTVRDCYPGLTDLICSAYARSPEHLNEKEDLMMELVSGEPSFHFIQLALQRKNIQKTSDSIQFFFFLALLCLNPDWNDATFQQDHEIITHNLHVIPCSINVFINLLSQFCQTSETKIVSSGMQFYFTVLQHIVQKKRENPDLLLKSTSSLIILADLFPKYINCIEYGRIGISFPYSVISEAYRLIEQNQANVKSLTAKFVSNIGQIKNFKARRGAKKQAAKKK